MRKLSKKTLAVATTVVLLSGGGAAYAYWTTNGAGTGQATSGTTAAADAIQLTQSSAITGLYPGGPVGNIMVTAKNPATFSQVVGQVTVTATYPTGCPETNWTLVNATDTFGTLATTVTSAAQSVGTIALKETGLNQDGCKTVTPTFALSSAPGA